MHINTSTAVGNSFNASHRDFSGFFFALLMVLSEETSGVFEPSVVSEIKKEEKGTTIRRNDTTK